MKNLKQILPALRMTLSQDQLINCRYVTDASSELLAKAKEVIADDLTDVENVKAMTSNLELPFALKTTDNEVIVVAATAADVKNYIAGTESNAKYTGRLQGRIVVITGGAQGFGAGVADEMFTEGANIVIADLNEELGNAKATELNATSETNQAVFVKVDVSNPESVEQMVRETVAFFGGLDCFVSNAGVLRAGGLDEMDAKTFAFMTNVNYTGYFNCAKYASEIMKIQNGFDSNHSADIIQINSKSGLKGSNKNFAYAGGKFGGIGLTQSFALELMPFRIKVNSICPGNFFDGPLWSDPKNGLFVQYLNAGKVAGAKTLDDVKAFYEAQVPAGRGCEALDVVRAIYYVIEQQYETGQAVPVTGGQNMLN
jgi:NAD(P)-dependent dehydrogenase (short-subunit alcohol dehydrogenase family)